MTLNICSDFSHIFVSEILKYFQYAFAQFFQSKNKQTNKTLK